MPPLRCPSLAPAPPSLPAHPQLLVPAQHHSFILGHSGGGTLGPQRGHGRQAQDTAHEGNGCFGPEMQLGLSMAEEYPDDQIVISKGYISGGMVAWETTPEGKLAFTGSCATGVRAG